MFFALRIRLSPQFDGEEELPPNQEPFELLLLIEGNHEELPEPELP